MCKPEDLSSDSQKPQKIQVWGPCGGRYRNRRSPSPTPLSLLASRPSQSVSTRFNKQFWSTQKSRPYTVTGQHSRAGLDGVGAGETGRAGSAPICCDSEGAGLDGVGAGETESWLCPSSAVIESELARAVLESSPWSYWVKKNWQAEQLSYHPGPPQHLRHL